MGCFSTAVLIANNLRDIEEDRKAAKKTLPVRFGKRFGKIEYVCALLGSLLPIFFLCQRHPFLLLTFLIILPIFPLLRALFQEKDNPYLLNQIFIRTAKLLWFFTFLFCLGWML